eukprot:4945322-Ditylum_brightwellii.AAC.1
MEYGLDEMTLLDIINVIIKPDAIDNFQDERSFVPCTIDVVYQILRNSKEITSLLSANSKDKQRADSTSIETRDHHFTK